MSGILTSLHTRGLLVCTRVRQRMKACLRSRQPFAIIAETAIYGAACALTSSLVSLLAHCPEKGESGLEYVQFNCGEGQYNPIASLLLTTSHSAVKLLYSGNNAGEIHAVSSFLAFITYSSLNVGLGGLPVPGGAFTATMLMGGLFGRSVGAICRDIGIDAASSGVYAVVGSAAMLCGFKQMTLASVLIVVECVDDLSLAPIVMLAVTISMAVNWTMNKHGYDEQVILDKKLPFLEGDPPYELDGIVALDLCDPLPTFAVLSPEASLEEVERALQDSQMNYFPIRDGESGPCIGIATRAHLQAMLDTAYNCDMPSATARSADREQLSRAGSKPNSAGSSASGIEMSRSAERLEDTDLVYHELCSGPLAADMMRSGIMQNRTASAVTKLPLHCVMDPTPLSVVEDMPAPRLYAFFSKAGERASCVTSRRGELRGIISREGLIAAARNQRHRQHSAEQTS
eukprot:gnl/MRDRNA2_/MRDRNA2_117052_c0_seq1.p1 gnl/MRDRNA2_/MRDRNA2_117052_c0~~gnl/MRDRNA2_/MRDRNA2_117052_c0_seq1.p1  ORF type:complete len:475 (+),score=57.02 gnl/MRDRNA2_/MRDRNA2_117052_c0_seq1:53-1426(+)